MRKASGIRRKIWVVFVLQLASISFATVIGVYGAATILEDLLIKQALRDEAGHYFGRLSTDAAAELPDTYNMHGYLAERGKSGDAVPAALRGLEPGFHHVGHEEGRDELVFVSDDAPGRLFLVFRQEQVH
ncbi:MAG TPA: hypothetical protein VJ724_01060, partial [Tahibacter sp.]|nr:hypothetical protein [Tahibacter sp.]